MIKVRKDVSDSEIVVGTEEKADLVETIRISGDGRGKRRSWKDPSQGSQRFILPDIDREFLEGEGFWHPLM